MPPSKAAVDVVADYLRSLKEHTIDTLERNFGKEFLEVTPIDYILTVPAVCFPSFFESREDVFSCPARVL